jgi:sulfane dehydrogenase subunit SoxC
MDAYRLRTSEEDPGSPVTRILPRFLMIPPGIADFFTRVRRVASGPCALSGRAWSGHGPVVRVEVSVDDGRTWAEADLSPSPSPHAWARWRFRWEASTGSAVLSSRATDAPGDDSAARSIRRVLVLLEVVDVQGAQRLGELALVRLSEIV